MEGGEEEGRGRGEGGKLREGEWVEVEEVREEGWKEMEDGRMNSIQVVNLAWITQ